MSAPPLDCKGLTDRTGLEKCYDDYLMAAWSDFNKKLSDFQKKCNTYGDENSQGCDYSEMMSAYKTLMASIETVLSAMNRALEMKVPSPSISNAYAEIKGMRDNLNRRIRELNEESTSRRGFMPDYKMKYDRVFYLRLVIVLSIAFVCFFIIYFLFFTKM
jgi:hypothetical protein